ncbi:cellulose-binding protein [Hymenobacter sp. BT188]|uniref:SGNH/GDSL hydrolase family protein n=1 Tax=Hymenobacter sp. BT188 TaxID=2763504 RepID=UPI0016517518|nr:SGNH/GDSL hydrolase family protein [Hymenobacter sp. BT188]MBC6608918.1 cellulose-binding protein [Hymenobacter sp. BT188]
MRAIRAFRPFRAFLLLLGLLLAFWIMASSYLNQDRVSIMPLGDSITHGNRHYASYRRPLWQKLQQAHYPVNFVGGRLLNKGGLGPHLDFDLHHQGQWGWTTPMLLAESRQWAQDQRPDIVLLHAGTNDCFGDKPVTEIRDNLGAIIDSLRAGNPRVKVLLAQLIPAAPPNERINPRIRALNALLPALAAKKTRAQSPVVIVDQHTGFSQIQNQDLHDGLHPNARGEEKLAARWFQALQAPELLGPPPAPTARAGVGTRGPTSFSWVGSATLTAAARRPHLSLD